MELQKIMLCFLEKLLYADSILIDHSKARSNRNNQLLALTRSYDQADPVLRFSITPIFFAKFAMCFYQKAGWPAYRDLSLSNRFILVHMKRSLEVLRMYSYNTSPDEHDN